MSSTVVTSVLPEFLQIQTRRAQLYTQFQDGFKRFLQTKNEAQYKALMADLTLAFSECSKQVIALEGALKQLGRADLAFTLRTVQEAERDKLRLTLTLQALRQAEAFRTLSWQQQQHGREDGSGGAAGGDWYDSHDDDEALALLDPHFATAPRGVCTHGHGCAHGHSHRHADKAPGAPSAAAYDEEMAGAGAGAGAGMSTKAAASRASSGLCGSTGARLENCGNGAERPSEAEACGAGGDEQAKGESGSAGTGGAGGCSGGAAAPTARAPTRQEFEAAVKEAMKGLDACIQKINEAIGDVRMELEDV